MGSSQCVRAGGEVELSATEITPVEHCNKFEDCYRWSMNGNVCVSTRRNSSTRVKIMAWNDSDEHNSQLIKDFCKTQKASTGPQHHVSGILCILTMFIWCTSFHRHTLYIVKEKTTVPPMPCCTPKSLQLGKANTIQFLEWLFFKDFGVRYINKYS